MMAQFVLPVRGSLPGKALSPAWLPGEGWIYCHFPALFKGNLRLLKGINGILGTARAKIRPSASYLNEVNSRYII